MLSEQDLLQLKVFQQLASLNLSKDEYVIFGSGIMFVLEIRPLKDLTDLDIFISPEGWKKLLKRVKTKIYHDDEWNCDYIQLFNKGIEIFNGWGPGTYNIEDMIKRSINIGMFSFASPQDVIKWKQDRGKLRDFEHVRQLKEYLQNRKVVKDN